MPTAFDPIELGELTLPNRIVMAPMSRSRSYGPAALPNDMTIEYYRQRASAGLLISEGIQPSAGGRGYPATPGLYSEEQVAAWKKVTDAVHAAGGRIFAQIMHAGRIGHPVHLPEGQLPVGPSPIAAQAKVFSQEGLLDCVVPDALTADDITAVIDEHVVAARNAIRAGFDGVEVHAANGFLVHQFLSDNANQRTDEWGGSEIANRIRFALELTRAVADAVGPRRVGIQISPGNPYNDIVESNPDEVYPALVEELNQLPLAYLALSEGPNRELTRAVRAKWHGNFILNPFTAPKTTGPDELALIDEGLADLISYGVLFLANPDLPRRLAQGGPFNEPDRATFYGGDAHGYLDYPTLDEVLAR
ncbi:MAG TPA: alkene reductase [Galbitalea sp.]|jgi:N-ethylmaleimide reductase|nr:alkene reductase [Galbitalea sp.]